MNTNHSDIIEQLKQTSSEKELLHILHHVQRSEDEKILQRFFDFSFDMLCVAGTDGYFKKVSRSFSKVLGYSQKELLSRPVSEFIAAEDRDKATVQLEDLSHGYPCYHLENRYVCKNGNVRWFAWRAVPVPDES